MKHELFELRRSVKFFGAYHDHEPRRYGRHNMDLQFAVIGARGAISISMYTGWWLPEDQLSHVQQYTKGYPFSPEDLARPNITDVGYHAKSPQYEDQSSQDDCDLTGGKCYYDGTSLWGNEKWREGFLHGGSDWLFEKMEEEYWHHFYDDKAPDLTPIPRKFK